MFDFLIENGGDIVECVSGCVSDRLGDLVDNIDDLLD